mmetsp:Transcript_13902/g.20344  ORF Transcript_13902/g.20344 Transcript_13902/m.20344 type:complete len:91 (+) Transcript_13902:36-308(+)
MVKFQDWDSFSVRGLELASADPVNTRWTVKLNPKKEQLVVKVTCKSHCLMYYLRDLDAEFNKVKQFSLNMTRYLTQFSEGKPKKKPRQRA